MKFIYIGPKTGVFGDCPDCIDDEVPPNYLCDPCDSVVLPGGIKGVAFKKCSYTFTDVTDQAEWETAIANKDVFIRLNGNRILGEMPDPDFSEKSRGSCSQPEVVKQSRTVKLIDAENDSILSIDDLYNFITSVTNQGKYDVGFISCDSRLIGENSGFFINVSIRAWATAPQTNEDDFVWNSEYRYQETQGAFYQISLPFLSLITPNVCWVESILVTGEGGAITVPNGSDLQMIATVTPSNATDPTVTWSVIPGTGTATINATTGLLTGTGVGTVTVVATANDASGVTGTLEITVT